MRRAVLLVLAAVAVALVVCTQILLSLESATPPECKCPPPAPPLACSKAVPRSEPCEDRPCIPQPPVVQRRELQTEERGRGLQMMPTGGGATLALPPERKAPSVRSERAIERSEEEKECVIVSGETGAELRSEEWARRLMRSTWEVRCSEATTGSDMLECLRKAAYRTDDWVAQLRASGVDRDIGELAELAAHQSEQPAVEMTRIEVTGGDLLYGDPGVRGYFSIVTKGYPFGGALFRVFFEGPEVTIADLEDHRDGTYTGSYLVGTAGMYTVTVVYESGHYEGHAVPPFVSGEEGHTLPCDGAVIYQGDLQVTGFSISSPSKLCKTLSELTYGRFVWTRIGEGGGENGSPALQWQPWECSWKRDWNLDSFQECVDYKKLGRVLLLGESNTAAVYKALGGDAVNSPAYCMFERELCAHMPMHFAFPSITEVSSLLPRHMPRWADYLSGRGPISTVAMPGRKNVLAWNVGTREIIEGQSIVEFSHNAADVNAAIATHWPGANLYRTSTAIHRRCSGEPERYWTLTNERMAVYSDAVERLVTAEGGTVLDSYNVTKAMRSTTSDLKSFSREQNHELAVLLLNALCVTHD
eukprot:CAMPEP_0114615078 /NCGR_PEP_ID=MMETSP0168-20121206/5980_1 /TAXON_ID=95228 ORGANISM="Vannella sp., Strain DIVA3 517/6/12" /NCGR_SAMPLE_ID=MMETSP0168 /ASSEMBLY_ACC=CAM_ASM_000044 /LENGTH=586 /DNA_ID=CAMNT_0001826139 /DNA_START=270 /DNA_END=2027 /DNA_ORIENTATION=+